MCGLAGIIWKNGASPREHTADILALFEPVFAHRGPDERSVHIEDAFGVVHRRLSIIDISTGQQPMFAEGGRVGIAYNGEVYNHKVLRAELEARGHSFATHCDTEVVLRMFVEYGPSSFERLDGMFAIFIWDYRGAAPAFYLARDHMGTKPLYVYEDAQCLAFSSELRPLLSLPGADLSLDPLGLQSYLTFRYTHAPRTFYKHIRRIEAGAYLKAQGGRVLRSRFWDLPMPETPLRITERDARARLVELLRSSVAAQQMSEVPVGLLLSGGLDSSVIAALCGELGVRMKSFNIGFPDVNEFKYSSEMARAFSLDHVTIETTIPAIIERFGRVVEAMDEPVADPACFPLHILCEEIRKSVTVVLSGEGSDEMLAGYPQYLHGLNDQSQESEAKFANFLRHSWYFADGLNAVMPASDPARTLQHSSYFVQRPLLEGMLAYDLKTWLPENLLMKADKILMSNSLEGRFPFLAKDVVEFVCSLPESMKVAADGGKHLLRRAFADRLPANIVKRPKMGFSVPIDQMAGELRVRGYDLLERMRTSELAEYLDFRELRRRFDAHYAGVAPNALWVWTVIVMLQWFAGATSVRALPAGARAKRSGAVDPVMAVAGY